MDGFDVPRAPFHWFKWYWEYDSYAEMFVSVIGAVSWENRKWYGYPFSSWKLGKRYSYGPYNSREDALNFLKWWNMCLSGFISELDVMSRSNKYVSIDVVG